MDPAEKRALFDEIHRLMKDGWETRVSDMCLQAIEEHPDDIDLVIKYAEVTDEGDNRTIYQPKHVILKGPFQGGLDRIDILLLLFERAVKIAPLNAELHYQFGKYLQDIFGYGAEYRRRSWEELLKAAELDPCHSGACDRMAIYFSRPKSEAPNWITADHIISYMERALACNSEDHWIMWRLAGYYNRYRKDFERALALYKNALSKIPKSSGWERHRQEVMTRIEEIEVMKRNHKRRER